ncbi:hypothetical protein [Streptomyces sp. S.PB5]|uniref:hypothetical protein n=1 Tax=Streptomyces sp. S.PB5 TaxID=3020844 RepID=UPI0025B0B8FC|nr:hypothetical protein [Streptomyces sp. S.PB5]MDN3028878.1 hypothetical protein [Streptomyces sp. S.PB5]
MPWNRNYGGRIAGRPAVAFVAFAGVVAAVLVGQGGLTTVVGCGMVSDEHPSQTAKDWVTYADQVVVATPEREQETDRRDFKSGMFAYQTDRTVTFRTDQVLWSSGKGSARTVDKGFDMVAPGWRVYRESGTRIKRTAPNASRLETGHTYLLALRWSGDGWTVLGEGAAVPFDDGVVDQGEWCGRVLSKEDVARGERFSRKDDDSLEKAVLGQDAAAVKRALDGARAKD